MRTRITADIQTGSRGALARLLGADNVFYLLSLKHEADQAYRKQALSGEFLLTLNRYRSSIGQLRPPVTATSDPPVRFGWRPYIGAEVGRVIEGAEEPEEDRTLLRLLTRVHAELRLREFLGVTDVVLFADDEFYHLPLASGRDTFNVVESGAEFPLTDNVSFVLSYRVGRAAPLFEKEETFSGSVGVKF